MKYYKLSFKLSSDDTEESIIPNLFKLSIDLQTLLTQYHNSNLKVQGYHLEHEQFTPFHQEDMQ